jgi:hypothetical protein
MTPDQLKALFDGNAIILIFVFGIITKYVPALRNVPNLVIPWVGAIGTILAKLAVGTAHAGFKDIVPDVGGVLISGFTSAIWARQLYEGFGRSFLERVLKLKGVA